MKRSALFPLAMLSLGLMLFHPGCGTDVGNAGKPVTSEPSELADVAALQHDEVITAINDGSDNDLASTLSLQGSGGGSGLTTIESSCTPNADGTISVKVSKSLALEHEFGRPSQRKLLKDTLASTLDSTWSAPQTAGSLSCNNNRPVLSLEQLVQLKTSSTLNKERTRLVTLKSDGSILSESELSAKGQRSVQFTAELTATGSLLTKTTSFSSEVSLLRKNAESPLTRSIASLEAEPIVLERNRTRGTGVTRVEIVSGAVASTHADATKVILRYKNLVLSLGKSCHPSSGSIEGQVFADAQAPSPSSSFSVVFDSEGATLIHEDGSEEELALEACQL